jgi:hypothetical protein
MTFSLRSASNALTPVFHALNIWSTNLGPLQGAGVREMVDPATWGRFSSTFFFRISSSLCLPCAVVRGLQKRVKIQVIFLEWRANV